MEKLLHRCNARRKKGKEKKGEEKKRKGKERKKEKRKKTSIISAYLAKVLRYITAVPHFSTVRFSGPEPAPRTTATLLSSIIHYNEEKRKIRYSLLPSTLLSVFSLSLVLFLSRMRDMRTYQRETFVLETLSVFPQRFNSAVLHGNETLIRPKLQTICSLPGNALERFITLYNALGCLRTLKVRLTDNR